MLVLTRKTNEEIIIGDDIKITLVRVRGNSVRIGIDAPRDVRIVRGELDTKPALGPANRSDKSAALDPLARPARSAAATPEQAEDRSRTRLGRLIEDDREIGAAATNRSILLGRVRRDQQEPSSCQAAAAPLARFLSPR